MFILSGHVHIYSVLLPFINLVDILYKKNLYLTYTLLTIAKLHKI